MYSDSYDNEMDLAQHFGLSNELQLLSDQFYEMPQSLDFGLENNDENDDDDDVDNGASNTNSHVMSSPLHHHTQPMTVRKLKSHLSGIGGEGGYLTSPMGGSGLVGRANLLLNQQTPTAITNNQRSANFHHHHQHQSPVKSAPMPSIATFQSTSHHNFNNILEGPQQFNTTGGHAMQRLRSAPPVPMPHSAQNTAGLGLASTSTAMQRARTTSAIGNSNNGEGTTSRGGVEVSSFDTLDYGSMQIYGRPIQRSKSEDPGPSTSTSSNTNNPSSSVYLPYPEHMPTVTLGRGAKNARDVEGSNSNSNSFISIQLPPSSRPEKPFIQYVAPNSPAGKQATARNKRQLTISTDGASGTTGSIKTTKASSSRMVPIKMTTTSPRQLPLSPPLTSVRPMSPHTLNNNNAYDDHPGSATSARFSPSKLEYNYPTSHDIHIATQSAPLPSFEWSVEQYGLHSQHPQMDDLHFELPGDETLDQHATYLGGLLPNSLPTSGMESTSLSPVSSSGGGLMSPPLYSASSTTSSMYSSSAEQQEALFGLPPSPLFDGPASIDQALASFLGEQQISMPSSQQQQQQQQQDDNNQTFSPSSNHRQQQTMLGMGSPPMSPLPQHQSQTSNFQWSPYSQQQQHQQQNVVTSPIHLEPLSHINNNLLSPHSNNNILSTVNGRQISSPRRLRGMQSAPDLGHMYSASNELSENTNVRSPSPRKASLKRQRSYYDSEDDFEVGTSKGKGGAGGGANVFGIPGEGDHSFSDGDDDDEDEYVPEDDDPRPRKRSCSISASTYAGVPLYQNSNEHFLQVFRADLQAAQQQQHQQQQIPKLTTQPLRMKPGPKPKTSLPNLRGRNSVFTVADNAPPVPPLPPLPPVDFASYTTLQIPQMSGNQNSHSLTSPLISPDLYSPNSYEAHQFQYQQQQQQQIPPQQLQPIPYRTATSTPPAGTQTHSKDELANYYETGTGSKQTKKGKPQRMYICKVQNCGKEFPRKSAVESHIQTHLDDKPFLCTAEGCGASFVRSHDLTRHMRIHSGSKPFECLCGKGFARGDALTRHRQRGICEGSLVPRRW